MSSDPLEQLLRDLGARSETSRLAAARTILDVMGDLSPATDTAVRGALARESVPWVRAVLLEILAKGDPGFETGVIVSAPSWDERLDSVDRDVARQVLNMSTERVLHEVSAVVGRVKLAARAELSTAYLSSETERELRFLSEVCEGLQTLASATQAPALTEFDLSQELDGLARSVSEERLCPVLASGPVPFITISDRALLCLAVRNVLINAVEATLSIGRADESRPIVLTWGSSPGGSHATVIDRGPGPPQFLVAVRNAGVSTKEGHPGYGLATASEAMRSLQGAVEIQRNDRGGATVVLSWKDDEA